MAGHPGSIWRGRMGRPTYRPTHAMQDPDLSDGKGIQRGRDYLQEGGPDDEKEKSYTWIRIARGCGAQLGC